MDDSGGTAREAAAALAAAAPPQGTSAAAPDPAPPGEPRPTARSPGADQRGGSSGVRNSVHSPTHRRSRPRVPRPRRAAPPHAGRPCPPPTTASRRPPHRRRAHHQPNATPRGLTHDRHRRTSHRRRPAARPRTAGRPRGARRPRRVAGCAARVELRARCTRERSSAGLAGVTPADLEQLESFGIVAGPGTGANATFNDGDLAIVRAAAGFLARGDRRPPPAGMASVGRARGRVCSSSGSCRCCASATHRHATTRRSCSNELASLGAELRAAIVARSCAITSTRSDAASRQRAVVR
jgi:hypothetical protein